MKAKMPAIVIGVIVCCVLSLTCSAVRAEEQIIKFNGEQEVSGANDPKMPLFKWENTSEGLHVEFQGAAATANYMEIRIPCQWTMPADGQVEVEVQSSGNPFRGYFVVSLVDASGKKYSANPGDPKLGFLFTSAPAIAPLLLSDFKDEAGNPLDAGTAIQSIKLVMTTVEDSNPKALNFAFIRIEDGAN